MAENLNPDIINCKEKKKGLSFYIFKGISYLNLNKFDKANKEFEKQIKQFLNDSSGYYFMGNIYCEQKKYNEAIDYYNKYIQFYEKKQLSKYDPPYWISRAYFNRGWAYVKLKEYDKGLNDYMQVIKLDPKDKMAYYNLACIYSLLNKINLSCEYIKKAIDLGYKNWKQMKNDEEFKNTYKSECFQKLMREYK